MNDLSDKLWETIASAEISAHKVDWERVPLVEGDGQRKRESVVADFNARAAGTDLTEGRSDPGVRRTTGVRTLNCFCRHREGDSAARGSAGLYLPGNRLPLDKGRGDEPMTHEKRRELPQLHCEIVGVQPNAHPSSSQRHNGLTAGQHEGLARRYCDERCLRRQPFGDPLCL